MFELRYCIRTRHFYDEDMCESKEDLNPILQYRVCKKEKVTYPNDNTFVQNVWSEWKDVETVREE